MNEIWKAIPGYEGYYEASTLGRIRSVERIVMNKAKVTGADRPCLIKSKILKPYARKFERSNILPRLCVAFSVGGKLKTQQVHSLVAKTFIPNPQGLETVNHKDGNPLNNMVENLEWLSRADNQRHAFANGLVKTQKPVAQLHPVTLEVIQVFPGAAAASRHIGVSDSKVGSAIRGGYKSGGYRWRYIDVDTEPVTTSRKA